jgi:cyclase
MNRRDAIKAVSGVVGALAVGHTARADEKPTPKSPPDFNKARIETAKLRDGLHLITGPGGNIAVSVGADGALLVDSGVPGRTDGIVAAVAALTPKPVRTLVNTHWHFDHAGGNEALGKAGVLVVAHDNTRARLSAEQEIAIAKMKFPAAPEAARPRVTFGDTLTLHHNGEEIHVRHVPPAHTDTDCWIFFRRANVLHLGDLYFNGTYPFIDSSTGGRLDGMIKAAEAALKVVDKDTKIIPGHGPVGGAGELKRYLTLLTDLRDLFRPLIAAGKTLPEVIAAKPTQKLDTVYGNGFLSGDLMAEVIYRSMAGDSK